MSESQSHLPWPSYPDPPEIEWCSPFIRYRQTWGGGHLSAFLRYGHAKDTGKPGFMRVAIVNGKLNEVSRWTHLVDEDQLRTSIERAIRDRHEVVQI